MQKKLSAEFIGTFWLTFGGCGSAVLAAAFPDVAAAHPSTVIVELAGAEHEAMEGWSATDDGRAALQAFLAQVANTERHARP